jgi:hypothetical protein
VRDKSFQNTIEDGTRHKSNHSCFTLDEIDFLKPKLMIVTINEEVFKKRFKFVLDNIPPMHLQAVHWLLYQNCRPPFALHAIAFIVALSGTQYVPKRTILRLHLDKLFSNSSFFNRMEYLAGCCRLAGVSTFIQLFAYLEIRDGEGGLVVKFGGIIDGDKQKNAGSKSYTAVKIETLTGRAKEAEFVKAWEKKGREGGATTEHNIDQIESTGRWTKQVSFL